MKRISTLVLLVTVAPACFGATRVAVAPSPLAWSGSVQKPVRVRISKNHEAIAIQGLEIQVKGEPRLSKVPGSFARLRVERAMTASGLGWKIHREQGGLSQDAIVTGSALELDGLDLREGNLALPNRLLLFAKLEKFDLVALVPLESYLVGVLASEMPLTWPLESLKAQAVAARSYALAVMRERKSLHYDVENSVLDQVFQSITRQHEQDKRIVKARQAVDETSEVVLLDQRGQVNKAYYHADCGGQTAPARDVWGSGEKTPVVVDSFCPGNPRSRWSLHLEESELRSKLSKKLLLASAIDSILPLKENPGQRASLLRFSLVDGSQRIMNAHEFREAVGYTDLRSTYFTVEKEGSGFDFQGRGWGHGVGLCQWGSRKLAELGQGAFEILKHYYPLSRLLGEIKGSPRIALKKTEPPE